MSTNFKQKAVVVGVSGAMAVLGGVAVAASVNRTDNALTSGYVVQTFSVKTADRAYIPETIALLESGNTFISTGTTGTSAGYITLTLAGSAYQGLFGQGSTTLASLYNTTPDATGLSYAAINMTSGGFICSNGVQSATQLYVGSLAASCSTTLNSASFILASALTLNGVSQTIGTLMAEYTTGSAAGTSGGTVVGRYYSNGKAVLALKAAAATSDETIKLVLGTLTATSGTATDVTMALADGNTLGTTGFGVTAGSVTISKAVNAATVLTALSTAALTVAAASSTAQKAIGFTLTGVDGITATNSPSNGTLSVLELVLSNGGKWFPNIGTTGLAHAASNGYFSIANTSIRSVSGAGTNALKLTLGDGGATGGGSRLFATNSKIELIDKASALDTSGVTGGSTVTVTVSGSGDFLTNAPITTFTYNAAAAVASAVTVAYNDSDASSSKPSVYVGRASQTGADGIKATESAPGAISASSIFTLTLGGGAKFASGAAAPFSASVSQVGSVTGSILSTPAASATGTTGAASTSAPGFLVIDALKLDLTGATAGDVKLSIAGAGATGTDIVVATAVGATKASASGTQPQIFTSASAATMPDIIITEAAKGALDTSSANDYISFQLPSGVQFDNTVVPTITVKNAAGTTQAGFVTTPTVSNYGNDSREFGFQLSAAWSSAEVYNITVSGLKVKATSNAPTGTIGLTIAGADTAPGTTLTSTFGSDHGVKAYKETITVATVANNVTPTIPTATSSGPTSAVTVATTLLPAGNDAGAQGSVFLAAVIPNVGVFFRGPAETAWASFTTCSSAPAFSTGSLGSTNVNIATGLNLRPFPGAQLYVGYGRGGALSPAGTACTNMLNNGSYSLVYTVPAS